MTYPGALRDEYPFVVSTSWAVWDIINMQSSFLKMFLIERN